MVRLRGTVSNGLLKARLGGRAEGRVSERLAVMWRKSVKTTQIMQLPRRAPTCLTAPHLLRLRRKARHGSLKRDTLTSYVQGRGAGDGRCDGNVTGDEDGGEDDMGEIRGKRSVWTHHATRVCVCVCVCVTVYRVRHRSGGGTDEFEHRLSAAPLLPAPRRPN